MLKKITKGLASFLVVILIVLNVPGSITPAQQTRTSLPPMPLAAVDVELFFLETAHANTLDVLTMAQGSMFSMFDLVPSAIPVAHGEDSRSSRGVALAGIFSGHQMETVRLERNQICRIRAKL
jgi:hypothetical protein